MLWVMEHDRTEIQCSITHKVSSKERESMKLKNIEQKDFYYSSQWDATDEDGNSVYIRYHFGVLTVSVNNEIIFMDIISQNGDESDAYTDIMSTSEMLSIIENIKPQINPPKEPKKESKVCKKKV